jgi:hypothetical protein
MLSMAKKRPIKAEQPKPEQAQTPFRCDPALMDAIDAYAQDNRRSRNLAMVILLEQALKAVGYWPPPPAQA